jgi:hypothetical protein
MTILSCCVLEGTFRFCFIQRLVITKHLHFRGVAPFEGLRRLANLARFELLVTEVSQRKGGIRIKWLMGLPAPSNP